MTRRKNAFTADLTHIQVSKSANKYLQGLRRRNMNSKGKEPMYSVVDRLINSDTEKRDLMEELELYRNLCIEKTQAIIKLNERIEQYQGLTAPLFKVE